MKIFWTIYAAVIISIGANPNTLWAQEITISQLCVDFTGGFKNDHVEILKDDEPVFSADVLVDDSQGASWCTEATKQGRRHELEIRINQKVFHLNLVMGQPRMWILIFKSQDGSSITFTITPNSPY